MTETLAQKIKHDDLVFMKIQDRSPLYLPQLKSYDAVIIEYSDELATRKMVNKIRCHNSEAIYLIPLFVYKIYDDETKSRHPLIDGTINSMNNLGKVAELSRKIKSKMNL